MHKGGKLKINRLDRDKKKKVDEDDIKCRGTDDIRKQQASIILCDQRSCAVECALSSLIEFSSLLFFGESHKLYPIEEFKNEEYSE